MPFGFPSHVKEGPVCWLFIYIYIYYYYYFQSTERKARGCYYKWTMVHCELQATLVVLSCNIFFLFVLKRLDKTVTT